MRPSKCATNARDELACPKRFSDVVDRAHIETCHRGIFVIGGGKEDHGHFRGSFACSRAYREPVTLRKRYIEQCDIEGRACQCFARRILRRASLNAESFTVKQIGKRAYDRSIIFNEQDVHEVLRSSEAFLTPSPFSQTPGKAPSSIPIIPALLYAQPRSFDSLTH